MHNLVLRVGLLLMAVLAASACDSEPQDFFAKPNKLVVVFTDVSATISNDDWSIYRSAFEQIVKDDDAIAGGDRVVLARISSTTLTEFAPIEDIAFPNTGVTLDDHDAADIARATLIVAFEEARNTSPSKWTHIIDATNAAAQVFRNDTSRTERHVIILSDMLEESGDSNFRLSPPGPEAAAAVIDQLEQQGRLPDLRGVHIHVVGATASSPQVMAQVEAFWRQFFKAAGAELSPGDYSRAAAEIRVSK